MKIPTRKDALVSAQERDATVLRRPSREQIEAIIRRYPSGATVELIDMDDCQAPPAGTLGKIFGVDAMGSVLVKWDNGSMLSLIPGVDSFRIVKVA